MRRSTIIFLVLLALMSGAYYYLNNRAKTADSSVTAEPSAEVSYVFTSTDGVPTSIHIESKAGDAVEVARGADKAWALILPTKAAADQGSVEAAASQVTTLRVLAHLPDVAPKDVGLDAPDHKIVVKFTNGVERNIEIGVITPTGSGYYIRVDGGEIVIVNKDTIDSLLALLSNPPYLPTETPLPPTPGAVSP